MQLVAGSKEKFLHTNKFKKNLFEIKLLLKFEKVVGNAGCLAEIGSPRQISGANVRSGTGKVSFN